MAGRDVKMLTFSFASGGTLVGVVILAKAGRGLDRSGEASDIGKDNTVFGMVRATSSSRGGLCLGFLSLPSGSITGILRFCNFFRNPPRHSCEFGCP